MQKLRYGELVTEVEHHYPEKDVKLYFYKVELVGDRLEVLEHEAVAWIRKEEKEKYEFAGADDGVVDKL